MTASKRETDGITHVWSIADNAWVTLEYWNYINGRQPKTHGVSGGVELTDDLIEELADEAEQDYPTERLRPRGEGSTPSLLAGSSSRNERNPVDEVQALRLCRLRSQRDRLMQRLAEVNAEIDEVIDGPARQELVDISPPDWSALVSYLRELHVDAGKPSARKVAEGSGGMVSHTTVSEVLRGARMPSWKSLWPIGKQLGADEATLKHIWLGCQMRPAVPGEAPPTSLLAGRIILVSYIAAQRS